MRFHPIALSSAIMLVCGGLSAPAYAISMEAFESNSALGQPFVGRLVMGGISDLTPNSSCFKVVNSENGIPGPGPLRITARTSGNGWIVSLRGEQKVSEPAVQFTLVFNCYGQTMSREYSVLLDLPAEAILAPTVDSSSEIVRDQLVVKAKNDRRTAHQSSRASSGKKKINRRKRGSVTQAYPRARSTAPVTGQSRDAIKLAVVPGEGSTSKREAELMAQAEDQASQLRQMELRILELQIMIEKMRVYVPEADAARLRVPGATASMPAALVAGSAASAAVVPSASASVTAASATVSAASSASASASIVGKNNPFDWMFWVWVSAAAFGVFAFLAYVLRQRRVEKLQAWGAQNAEELLDSYAPVRRAEVEARINAEANRVHLEDEKADIPVSIAPLVEPQALPVSTPRDTAVEFVDVQHAGSAVEEAQWLISHGEGERAIGLLREEIRTNPEQTDLWLMLFDYLYNQKKNLEFVTLAHRFRRQATGTDAWKQVCDLGLKLDPDNRLFLSRNA